MLVAEHKQLQPIVTPLMGNLSASMLMLFMFMACRFMEGAQTLEVPKTTLPLLLADMNVEGPINLLKIDVSGINMQHKA